MRQERGTGDYPVSRPQLLRLSPGLRLRRHCRAACPLPALRAQSTLLPNPGAGSARPRWPFPSWFPTLTSLFHFSSELILPSRPEQPQASPGLDWPLSLSEPGHSAHSECVSSGHPSIIPSPNLDPLSPPAPGKMYHYLHPRHFPDQSTS